jgi:hypothetical protein
MEMIALSMRHPTARLTAQTILTRGTNTPQTALVEEVAIIHFKDGGVPRRWFKQCRNITDREVALEMAAHTAPGKGVAAEAATRVDQVIALHPPVLALLGVADVAAECHEVHRLTAGTLFTLATQAIRMIPQTTTITGMDMDMMTMMRSTPTRKHTFAACGDRNLTSVYSLYPPVKLRLQRRKNG